MTPAEYRILSDTPSGAIEMLVTGTDLDALLPTPVLANSVWGGKGEIAVRTDRESKPFSARASGFGIDIGADTFGGSDAVSLTIIVNHGLRASKREEFDRVMRVITEGLGNLP